MHSLAAERRAHRKKRSKRRAIFSVSPPIYTWWPSVLSNEETVQRRGGGYPTRNYPSRLGKTANYRPRCRATLVDHFRFRAQKRNEKQDEQRWRGLKKRRFRASHVLRGCIWRLFTALFAPSPHFCSLSLSCSSLFIPTSSTVLFPPPYCCSCHG